ncbi:NADP-dependent oxidoreductase [Rhodococcus sp. BH4]|uniref:NADP-dependent oxidoreductase n=1 Tax=Rhodococcus sp. BH4 TaxID=1807790 RepID=UPI001E5EF83A|nr:NADP-dependent oxidoreductase [Rhodococcus sp. BH4]
MCLSSRPAGRLVPDNLAIVHAEVPPLAPGEVLIRNTWLSIDPSIRLRLNAATTPGYLPPLTPGDPLVGLALGTVIESRSPEFAAGELVSHMFGYRDYAVVTAGGETLGGAGGLTRIDPGEFAPEWYLGPLGSAGLTAYVGLFEILELKPEDVLWVSAAAGAVGSIAVQLATLRGNTVVASAGGPEKVEYLRNTLGASHAIDYRADDLKKQLTEFVPDGIDAYFDNVGGDHLGAALDHLRPGGRVAMCGAVSTYDTDSPVPGPANLFQVTAKSLQIRGFRAGTYDELYTDFRSEVGGHLNARRLTCQETVFEGLEQAPAALVGMLNGHNIGKTLCRL